MFMKLGSLAALATVANAATNYAVPDEVAEDYCNMCRTGALNWEENCTPLISMVCEQEPHNYFADVDPMLVDYCETKSCANYLSGPTKQKYRDGCWNDVKDQADTKCPEAGYEAVEVQDWNIDPMWEEGSFCTACRTGATLWDVFCPPVAVALCQDPTVINKDFCNACMSTDSGSGSGSGMHDDDGMIPAECQEALMRGADAVCPAGLPTNSDEAFCTGCNSLVNDFDDTCLGSGAIQNMCSTATIINKDFCVPAMGLCDVASPAYDMESCAWVIKSNTDNDCRYKPNEALVAASAGLYWVGGDVGAVSQISTTVEAYDDDMPNLDDTVRGGVQGVDGVYIKTYTRPEIADAYPGEEHWVFYTSDNYLYYTSLDDFYRIEHNNDVPARTWTFLNHIDMHDDDTEESTFHGLAIHQETVVNSDDDYYVYNGGSGSGSTWGETRHHRNTTENWEVVFAVAYDGSKIISRRFNVWEPVHRYAMSVDTVYEVPSGLARDLEIDSANKFMYWTELYGGVFRAPFTLDMAVDPLTVEQLFSSTATAGIALTPYALFRIDGNTVHRSNLDGSGSVPIVTISDASELFDVTIDEYGFHKDGVLPPDAPMGMLYISDRTGHKIYTCTIDGDDLEVYYQTGSTFPRGMAVGWTAQESAGSLAAPSSGLALAFMAVVTAILSMRS